LLRACQQGAEGLTGGLGGLDLVVEAAEGGTVLRRQAEVVEGEPDLN
jgi:hypothetical protein